MRAKLRTPAIIGLFLLVLALTVPATAVSAAGWTPWKIGKTARLNNSGISNVSAAASSPALDKIIKTREAAARAKPQGLDSAGKSPRPDTRSKPRGSDAVAQPLAPDAVAVSRPALPPAKPQAVDTAIQSRSLDTIVKTDPGNTIDFNSMRLVNNDWGAPLDENLTSGVYLAPDNSFGWYWNRQAPREKSGVSGLLPIYPSVRVGGSPWDPSNSVSFPVKLSDVKSLTLGLTYNYPTVPDGLYDFAYDMFLTDTNQPCSSPKRNAEVMIWIHRTLSPPDGCYRGDFTDGNNTYGLYSYVMADGRLYFAFVMKGQPAFNAQHTVDAKKLLDILNLNPNWYIPGIELGNEIINGSGKIEITRFDVALNGQNS